MKWINLIIATLLFYSCADIGDDAWKTTSPNPTTTKSNDRGIDYDDVSGLWIGTDIYGKTCYFYVDKQRYTLAFDKKNVQPHESNDDTLPPLLPNPQRHDHLNFNPKSHNSLTFENYVRNADLITISGSTSDIQYDGYQFQIRNIVADKVHDLIGETYPGDSKLHLTLFPQSFPSDFQVDFIFESQDIAQKIANRPKRDIVDPPSIIYRRDTRDPSDIFTNGFQPRGSNNDLIAHVSGLSLYQPGIPPSGWVSASGSLYWTTNPSQPMPNNEFWVYAIVPTSNCYNVVHSFQHFISSDAPNTDQSNYINQLLLIYGNQHEWATLGSISNRNIRRALRYRFDGGEYRQVEIRENPYYDPSVIPAANPNPYRIFSTIPGFTNQFFRADIRTPDQIMEMSGIIQDGIDDESYLSWGTNVEQMNLYRHSRASYRDSFGYLSISNTLWRAHMEGTRLFTDRDYYIYVIAQAPNIFNTSNILGRFRNQENLFSVMGGIPITQIIGWYTVTDGHIASTMTPNRAHRANLFRDLNIIDGAAGYPYAGFPLAHNAWLEAPWRDYAPEYCERPNRAPELKRDVALSWCEYNTNAKSKKLFLDFKTRFYTSAYGPR